MAILHESDHSSASTQAVANTCRFVANRTRGIVPTEYEGMVAAVLMLRPNWSANLSRADRIRLQNARHQWRRAWAGCKVLKQGQHQVSQVLV